MRKIAVMLVLALLLCGCQFIPAGTESTPDTQGQPIQTDPKPTTTQPPASQPTFSIPEDPVTVYAGAVEKYLSIEDFSWEREHAPEFVMLHFTSAVVLDRKNPYNMDKIREIMVSYETSTNYIIDRDGTVYCYIPEDRVAWHAGEGTFGGDEKYTNNMNHYSIGIELVGIGSKNDMKGYLSSSVYDSLDQSLIGYTQAQYEALAELVADICTRNEIPMDRQHIIGHDEYTPRKTDPGELFDWSKLLPEAE